MHETVQFLFTLTPCFAPGLTIPPDGIIVMGSFPVYLILNSPGKDPSFKTKISCLNTLQSATVTPKSAGPLSSNWGDGVYLTTKRKRKYHTLFFCFSCFTALSWTRKFWSSKVNWCLHFSLPSIISADVLGNRCSLQWVQKVMVSDLWLVGFDLFCVFLCFKVH